jgi:tyrosyl-tRNA synthetase
VSDPSALPSHLEEAHRRLAAGAAQILPEGGLAEKLAAADRAGRPLRVKHGIDPSGTELTIGHAVVLRKLRQFQDLGHLVVLVVGDFTGMVGDPSGQSITRRQLTAAQTEANSATYLDQLMRVLDPDRIEVRRNSEWLAGMTLADVVRETAVLTVAQLLERDDFAKRFAAHQPISLSEFLYPFLQGYDSVAIEADIELGGTDQTYNLLVGRDLQRAHGQVQQVVLTLPLLEGLDGVQKMSKSLGNYVAIAEPAAEQFGKLMSIPDPLVARYATLATDLGPDEVAGIERAIAQGGSGANAAKRQVARAIVALYHPDPAAEQAEAAFNQVFQRREIPTDVPEVRLPDGDPVHLPAVLRAAGLVSSTSQARRQLADGAVRVDGTRLGPDTLDLPRADLVGRVVQVGRRHAARLID